MLLADRFQTLLACAAVVLCQPGLAQDQDRIRPRIGLVLSGGGARGAAHVGVIKVLEELRIPIDMISSNSMGAIVGGTYAYGYSPAEMADILTKVDWPLVMKDGSKRDDLSFRRKQDDLGFLVDYEIGMRGFTPVWPKGIAQGHRVLIFKFLMPGWTEIGSFDDLPIRFRAVATDIENGQQVILSSGSLPLAIAASMSIPGVFAPVRIDGKELIDGMVVNNIPMNAGETIPAVTISGTGFVVNASVSFENGTGPAPTVSNVVVGGGGTTITASHA